MKVSIFNIDYDRAETKNELFFQFTIISSIYHDIVIKVYDPYFKSDLGTLPHELTCIPGDSYWVEYIVSDYTPWGTTSGPSFGFNGGFVIEFFSKTTKDRVIKTYPNIGKIYKYKNLSEQTPDADRRIYMIGNSHIWSTFGKEDENINKIRHFVLSKIAIYGLSLYRFFTGDYIKFINLLPIVDNDVLLFYWGSHDIRSGVFKQVEKYDITLDEALYNVMYLYYYSIKNLMNTYPKNKIIICSINVAIKKNHFKEEDHQIVFHNSEDEERLKITNKFNDFMNRKLYEIPNVTYFKWDENYIDKYGYLRSELLYENDIHINTSDNALELLSQHLYNWGI